MEIKFKDKPVTIKTVVIDGKKMTMQLLKQIPLSSYVYHINEKGYRISGIKKKIKDESYDNYDNVDNAESGYIVDGEIIGKYNIKIENKTGDLIYTIGSRNNRDFILYVNTDGELRTGLLDNFSKAVLKIDPELLYIH